MDNPAFEIRESSPPTFGHGKGSVEMVDISGDVIKETNASKAQLDHTDDTDYVEPDIFGQLVVNFRSYIHEAFVSNKRKFKILAIIISIILFHIYLILAIRYSIVSNKLDWCDGTGFLIILTSFTYWIVFYNLVLKQLLGKQIQRAILLPLTEVLRPIWTLPYISVAVGFLCFGAILTFVVLDAWEQPRRLVSASGVLVVLAIGLLLSKHPGRVKWRQVLWGLGLQFVFAVIILRWDSGRDAFDCMSSKVKTFLDFTDHGTSLVYGYLATGYNNTLESGENVYLPPVFLFKALSVIFFFSFFISLLYHYGVMMAIIGKLGWFLQITVGTTAAESMSAAANIFVGQTEAPILIKPFLPEMTKSELHAVMTGGFATIAGSVMGAYISFGINPSYLLSASIMAAPAALAMSKLIYPETVRSKTTADQLKSFSLRTTGSALDAAAQGATQGVMLIGNIAANVIAFMAFVAFLNSLFSWCGSLLGFEELTFEWLLGKLFIPMAYVIGVDAEEVEDVALLLGLKTVVNEFVAYQRLVSPSMKHLSDRSRAITTYALCSFANFSSIGVQLGGIGFMAPERRTELAETIWYAFVAGTFCGLLNACLAGTLLSSNGYQMALNVTTPALYSKS